jgi:WD40 repeat protein
VNLPKVEITDAILCDNDQILLCGDTSGRLIKVSTTTGDASPAVQSHRRRIQNLRSHPTNSKLVTIASWDTTASIFDIATLEPVMMFTGHADRVRDAMLSANGLTMVTVSDDRTCRFWDARTGKQLHVSSLPERPLAIEYCTNDSATVIDNQASRFTVKRGVNKPVNVQRQRFPTPLTAVRTNGSQAIYMAGSQVAIFNARNNRAKTLTSSDQITASFVNGMSQIMASGTNTGSIQVWDTGPMTQLIEAECADCAIASLGYS